jgi:transcriptional regulator with XRE-family HTH domain
MPTQAKKIGNRIRELRKLELLTQEEFALELGVKQGYISALEIHKNEPSEQLILSICRTFGVSYDWLKYAIGKKYLEPRLTYRGQLILEKIIKEVESPERIYSLRELAELIGIDPDMPSNKSNLPESFYWTIRVLIYIFREGDPGKIEAILAQLNAFIPKAFSKYKEGILSSKTEESKA